MHRLSTRSAKAGPVVLIALAALALASMATAAPPVVNDVTVTKDVTDVQPDTNPCNGNPTVVTGVSRSTFRIVAFADGTIHVMFTAHGVLSVHSLVPTDPDYTGSWTESSEFNGTNGSATSTFTFTPHLNGTDGSKLFFHYTGHMTVTANGDVTVDFVRAVSNNGCNL